MASGKGKNKVNFTQEERTTFLEILRSHKDVIENKKTDAASMKKKESSWKQVTELFNGCSIVAQQRTTEQLKKWWSNIKQQQRNAKATEKQSIIATGGGPAGPSANVDPLVEAIAPHLMLNAPCAFSSNSSKEATAFNDELLSSGNLAELEKILTDKSGSDNVSQQQRAVSQQQRALSSVVSRYSGNDILQEGSRSIFDDDNEEDTSDTETAPVTVSERTLNIPDVGVDAPKPSDDEPPKKRSRKANVEGDPRMQLSLNHMREIHALKLEQMKLEFERKQSHERRLEDIELETAYAKLKFEKAKLREINTAT